MQSTGKPSYDQHNSVKASFVLVLVKSEHCIQLDVTSYPYCVRDEIYSRGNILNRGGFNLGSLTNGQSERFKQQTSDSLRRRVSNHQSETASHGEEGRGTKVGVDVSVTVMRDERSEQQFWTVVDQNYGRRNAITVMGKLGTVCVRVCVFENVCVCFFLHISIEQSKSGAASS